MAPKGPLRDLRNLALKKLRDDHSESSSEVAEDDDDESFNEGMSFAIPNANDMVEDWWSKYGSSLVPTVPERRHSSVLSNVEISVAKKRHGSDFLNH